MHPSTVVSVVLASLVLLSGCSGASVLHESEKDEPGGVATAVQADMGCTVTNTKVAVTITAGPNEPGSTSAQVSYGYNAAMAPNCGTTVTFNPGEFAIADANGQTVYGPVGVTGRADNPAGPTSTASVSAKPFLVNGLAPGSYTITLSASATASNGASFATFTGEKTLMMPPPQGP
jgi:hypothetical protein